MSAGKEATITVADISLAERGLADRVTGLLGVEVESLTRLHSGDLSTVHCAELADGRSVVAKESCTVARESAMLWAMDSAGAPVPTVLAEEPGLMVMEHMPSGGGFGAAWGDLAQVLLRLHSRHGREYGWSVDYAFGPVDMHNAPLPLRPDWPSFWAERRLLCHLSELPFPLASRIERLCSRIEDHLPADPPASLLHGDLWGGNVLVSEGRVSALIDPACYYGDREVDAAMLTLFDHPPARFFEALELEPGWTERQPVYRLWPWLVHLRLFGGGYRGAVEGCLAELGV